MDDEMNRMEREEKTNRLEKLSLDGGMGEAYTDINV